LCLADGRYRITARFEGHGAKAVNPDTSGIALLNFRTGAVQSESAEFEICKQAAPKRAATITSETKTGFLEIGAAKPVRWGWGT
jgi:hypothetical protein